MPTAGDGGPKESTDAFVLYCIIAALLVLLAGLMSGLTLGLLSLDSVAIEVSTNACLLRMACYPGGPSNYHTQLALQKLSFARGERTVLLDSVT